MSGKAYTPPTRAPAHAGKVLKSGFIDTYGLRIETVASLLGISRVHLSRILNGHNPVTADIAIRLEALTQTPASQWLTLQANYDAYRLAQEPHFRKYMAALQRWASNALSMQPKERRQNQEIRKLREEAAGFAARLDKQNAT